MYCEALPDASPSSRRRRDAPKLHDVHDVGMLRARLWAQPLEVEIPGRPQVDASPRESAVPVGTVGGGDGVEGIGGHDPGRVQLADQLLLDGFEDVVNADEVAARPTVDRDIATVAGGSHRRGEAEYARLRKVAREGRLVDDEVPHHALGMAPADIPNQWEAAEGRVNEDGRVRGDGRGHGEHCDGRQRLSAGLHERWASGVEPIKEVGIDRRADGGVGGVGAVAVGRD
ncbi:hypothetical protein C8Q77DRAFT_362739 [Trametes polyzona]|nr:hypothetical protein C8Q77DRAFT_362739 [Trametes polyzona]